MFPQGHVFKDYKLTSSAKPGSFGEVYKALHIPTSKEVALKFSSRAHDPFWYKRFKNENVYLHHLDPHDNIVKAYSNVTHDKLHAYYAMEYLEDDLQQYLSRLKADEIDVKLSLFKQICLGLKHAHAQQIYHRDLHSQNVRINADTAKLTDFGLSKDGKTSNDSSLRAIIWQGAVTTPEAFFAIKDTTAAGDDIARDIYALGIILFSIFSSSGVAYQTNLKNSMHVYLLSNIPGITDFNTYLALVESDRKAHYDNWLSSLNIGMSMTLNIFTTDIDRGKKISEMIKKASHADYRQRYSDVQSILDELEGI
jgi:serine/threonine protein kinase